MDFIYFLLLVTILILIITLKNRINDRFAVFEREIIRLRQLLEKGNTIIKEDKPVQPVVPQPVKQVQERPVIIEPVQEPKIEKPIVPIQQPKPVAAVAPPPPKVKKPGFFERHPDLEKFIGENLVSKIGIAILVLAIGFFVKYAIDNNWIGPVGRVAIGLLCGAILVGVAHYLRNNYKGFSSVLIGGGIAIFYFTISLAYHQFHLFSQTVSFIIMVVITAFAVILSMLYNRQELAIIALLGGFLTPFLVSNGSGNYKTLFVYLIILNVGLLVIALKKSWRLLNLLAFVFTVIILGSWLSMLPYGESPVTYGNGFIFATIFYLLFFVINIIHNIKEKKKFIASDFGILLSNTCLYFAVGLYCLNLMRATEYQGIFSITMSVFNLGTSYFLFRKNNVDTNILYLLIGITLTFISLTAPIQLQGNFITLFWASEAVLLYWLYQKSGIKIIRLASAIIWVCMLISLIIDIGYIYAFRNEPLRIIFNKGFITVLVGAASSYLLFLLRRKDPVENRKGISLLVPGKNVLRVTALVLLYLAGYFEIQYQFDRHYPSVDLSGLYLIFYTLLFIVALLNITSRVPSLKIDLRVKIGLLAAGIIIYLSQIQYSFDIQRSILKLQGISFHFWVHWLSTVVVGVIFFELVKVFRSVKNNNNEWLTWGICLLVIIFLTTELHLVVNSLFYTDDASLFSIRKVYVKTGWPILWGLLSFGFMWLGMRNKFRMLRIISLTLFTITLVKLFMFDIVNIPAGGKIAAFFCLGVLLLVVSFMYQRLKKIIIDEETANK